MNAAAGNANELAVRVVTPAVGAVISGVDLSAPLSDETVAAIRRIWLDHGVVFFHDQRLDPSDFVALARRFGEIGDYPFVSGLADHPEITEVIKHEHETVNFGGLWHTDTTYLERPPIGSLLYALEVPDSGGDTLFASTYAAYDALSDGMRRTLSGLRAVSSASKPDAALTRVDRRRERPKDASEVKTTAVHPIIRTHPETARKSLYVSPGHTCSIDGFNQAESDALLGYLFQLQTRPEFTCRFTWRAGSLAFWDNRCTLHNAVNDYHGQRRVMHRITLAGEVPV